MQKKLYFCILKWICYIHIDKRCVNILKNRLKMTSTIILE